MTGLVAAGIVMVLYVGANWLWGRIAGARRRVYEPPVWWQVWYVCALPLAGGILIITMTQNWPTLPLSNALSCVASTWAGLALALMPGAWAAQRPWDLVWLACDGLGLMPALLLLRAVELPGRISITCPVAWLFAVGGTLAGFAWLGVMSVLRAWRRTGSPSATQLLAAGLGLSYVLMPLVHHLLATPPGYRYISTASNFFAFDWRIQMLIYGVAIGLAAGITRLRARWERRPSGFEPG